MFISVYILCIWFHTVFERINCLSTVRYKLIFFFRTSKIFYGQLHFGYLLVLGQVENFTISTPLLYVSICEISSLNHNHIKFSEN